MFQHCCISTSLPLPFVLPSQGEVCSYEGTTAATSIKLSTLRTPYLNSVHNATSINSMPVNIGEGIPVDCTGCQSNLVIPQICRFKMFRKFTQRQPIS